MLSFNLSVDDPYFSHDFVAEYQQQQKQSRDKELVADITPLSDNNLSPAYENNETKKSADSNNNKVLFAENISFDLPGYGKFDQKGPEPEIPVSKTKQIETTSFRTKNIVFKVQIGAFKNPVNPDQFHGLSPLSTDNSDKDYACKYMVGNYYSYKAADEAKNIIIGTSPYKDAFIVAYIDGERTDISTALMDTGNKDNINYACKGNNE